MIIIIFVIGIFSGCIGRDGEREVLKVTDFTDNGKIISNPLIGYAPDINGTAEEEDTLRYLEIIWKDIEPEEGKYAFDEVFEKYDFDNLKEEGIHLVIRFVCDKPGTETHMDIPDWLYQATGDGVYYDTSYGKGYAPDYNNETIRKAHKKVIEAIGAYFGDDGFVSYVEIGSLGHWGEWHVKEGEGLPTFPNEEVRNAYAHDYIDSFPQAKLLMRRPFAFAADNGLGLFNDMTGDEESTVTWLRWINNGGDFDLTEEEGALKEMSDFWKTSPCGGEFTSGLSMKEMLLWDIEDTVRLVRKSHMSFIGPKTAERTGQFKEGADKVRKELGYRLVINQARIEQGKRKSYVSVDIANVGNAGFYWDWPIVIYFENEEGRVVSEVRTDAKTTEFVPNEKINVSAEIPEDIDISDESIQVYIGIVDPMTGKNAVGFAINAEEKEGRTRLF